MSDALSSGETGDSSLSPIRPVDRAQRTKLQSEIQPGDIILFFGTPHRIDRIDPPSEATLSFFPTCCGFARSDDGWGISLDGRPYMQIEVV